MPDGDAPYHAHIYYAAFEQGKVPLRSDDHVLRQWPSNILEPGLNWHFAYSTRRPLMLGFTRLGLD